MTESVKEYTHRKARRPRWHGYYGSRAKGSVRWSAKDGGYRVTYSWLLGYTTTQRASDVWDRWCVAMNQYREHDRHVRETQTAIRLHVGPTA